MKNEDIDDYYFESVIVYLHVLLILSVLVFWGMAFFRNNALRKYYPLKKAYFLKLTFQLFIGFFLLVFSFRSFNSGLMVKTRSLLSKEELKKEIITLNQAMLFLPESKEDYEYTQQIYPQSFPGEDTYIHHYKDAEWEKEYDLFLNKETYDPAEHPENTDSIGDDVYQFYRYRKEEVVTDCDYSSSKHILSFFKISERPDFEEYGFYNYSGGYMPLAVLDHPRATYYYYSETNDFLRYAPKLFGWIRNRENDSIKNLLSDFQKILDKHQILYYLNTSDLVDFFDSKDYKLDNYRLVKSDLWVQNGELKWDGTYNYTYDYGKLRNLHSNILFAYNYSYPMDVYWALIVLALVLVFLVILSEFAPLLAFVFSVPIAVGLIVSNVLIVVFLHSIGIRSESVFLFVPILTGLLILFFAVQSVRTRMNKKLSGILVVLGYYVIPAIPLLLVIFLDFVTRYRIVEECDVYSSTQYTFWNDLANNHSFMISIGIVAWLLYMGIIKKFYAKPE